MMRRDLLWLLAGIGWAWLALLVFVYQALGSTAGDRASLEFQLALAGVLAGALASLIAWIVVWVRSYESGASAIYGSGSDEAPEPDIPVGKAKWDEEFDTGSTGDELEDLGLVKHVPPLPSDSEQRGR